MRLCVIGDPISHSMSPQIHQQFLKQDQREGSYEKIRVTKETLPMFLEEARQSYQGFNVTMPLKEAIVPFLDELDKSVHESVNTVVNCNGKLTGYNTDGLGFLDTLPFSVSGKTVALLGYGGAGKELYAALTEQSAHVQIFLRNADKREGSLPIDTLKDHLRQCHLLINATPLGMAGKETFHSFSFLDHAPKECLVYDLVYIPGEETALVREAKKRNLQTISGNSLLMAQAKRAYRLFCPCNMGK